MSHLDIDRLLAVLVGHGADEEELHLEGCPTCGRELEVWRRRIHDLRGLEASAVGALEMHNLRVLFRELGPAPGGRRWLAHPTGGRRPAVAAVRGPLSPTFHAYEAGPFRIAVQVRPSEIEDRFDLHGQLESEHGEVSVNAPFVLTSEEGYVGRTALDRFGEFRLTGVPAGLCRLQWIVDEQRIDLTTLTVGEFDGDVES
jgi:hypothetical protein